MEPNTLDLQIDLAGLQATFFRRLQRQLDVIKVLQVGCASVTAEQVGEEHGFGAFVPADGAQLPHERAKIEAQHWLLRGFLRDAIESTNLFLDECLQVCERMRLAARGVAKRAEIRRLLKDVARKDHRLPLSQKIEKLERIFGVSTRFNPHVLSLNRARTCVVHRLSDVSLLDVDETGILKLTLQRAQLIAVGQQTGTALILDKSGITVPEASMLSLHFVDNELAFAPGDRVELSARDLNDIVITLWRFGIASAQAVEAYGLSIGINFDSPKGDG